MLETYLNHIDEHIRFLHATKKVRNVDFHLHHGCEIYFLLQGDVHYFVEKTVYPLRFGDLILTNEHEIHKPSFSSESVYERITLEFPPTLALLYQTAEFQPLSCFYDRPKGERNKLSLSSKETSALLGLFLRYEQLQKNPSPGDAILKLSCFMELLVYINALFSMNKQPDTGLDLHHKLSPVLDYIERHLEEDLSLDRLEKLFYINKYYLIKLFKKYTGSTIHEYIVSKRISLAKKLLSEGCNVTEAYLQCGFNDYTSFLRMFKKKVGLLPKDYPEAVRSPRLAKQ
ncbi:AraC family transcriptional regulator [Paenibacillus filicis]|uniref:AraC family transcriptional regulator n=1 Tax=Paenibacillus gyeongsangnamensis TaxID=3388067 RepID=A0ABT4Q4V0_9BACL|nr:AraC family transcriptional regulator [Paenibacillus filicis]MCZ8511894.1 AraC family transcriptional regulator [Paenibacillus filicis]